jgi:hypothetical protein
MDLLDALDFIPGKTTIGCLFNRWAISIILIIVGIVMAVMNEPPVSYAGFGLIAAGVGVLSWAISKNHPF